MNIKLLALDIGGVLAHINKSKLFFHCYKAGINIQDFFDEDFLLLQRGLIPSTQFIKNKSSKLSLEAKKFESIFCSMVQALPISYHLNQLKVPWVFFSNINELHYYHFVKKLKLSPFTKNNSILSFKEKQLKPHKQFFERLSYISSINREHILLIDDKETNVTTAIKYGFQALLFEDDTSLLSFFNKKSNSFSCAFGSINE
ncbi:MAG: hypothetical protein KC505_03460 [Myxococcales bacterium]|nr:hypothetical protein [Myxococcales bacterium]USN51557.1 MAG: hypothetical protein H6731_03880 [Myxococcales bacterium]